MSRMTCGIIHTARQQWRDFSEEERNARGCNTNACSILPPKDGMECSSDNTPSPHQSGSASGQTPKPQVTPSVYQDETKICKGPCGLGYPRSAEFFQRCRKYKDGLESWCKICSRQRRRERALRAGIRVEHPPRYTIDSLGIVRCLRCSGQVYDSGLDDEWYCVSCGAYVNPPPKPARLAGRLLRGHRQWTRSLCLVRSRLNRSGIGRSSTVRRSRCHRPSSGCSHSWSRTPIASPRLAS